MIEEIFPTRVVVDHANDTGMTMLFMPTDEDRTELDTEAGACRWFYANRPSHPPGESRDNGTEST